MDGLSETSWQASDFSEDSTSVLLSIWNLKHWQVDLVHVLHRPVEVATESDGMDSTNLK